ncbi:PcfK-like family protein [Duncaniella dubosii]|uniref:PcfK-like family protein n=1 Tax=Duncaniella dubosii TaxID=2518971 RepID=UPI0023F2E891|nr:PcfK-like family protein [Duncaniella dubosii]MCX4285572.1 PcfK-like family protein [Duncaniella dubosii]
MKSSENFIEAIRQYLDSRAASDNLFAIRYASPSKSVAECCQYILNEVKRQGVAVLTNDEVYSLATHYWDGDCTAEEIGKPINCKVVISKDQLTEEDKAELKEQAMEQYKQEQLREIRRQSAPKAQPKPTANTPKAGAEIDSIPNLFDEL